LPWPYTKNDNGYGQVVYKGVKWKAHRLICEISLAAYCLAHNLNMHEAGETELARIWTKVDAIRAKQAAKPVGSALPIATPRPAAPTDGDIGALVERLKHRASTMNGVTPVGASDGNTYAVGYYGLVDRKLDNEAATALATMSAANADLRRRVIDECAAIAKKHLTGYDDGDDGFGVESAILALKRRSA
jgi:hypothetical protein